MPKINISKEDISHYEVLNKLGFKQKLLENIKINELSSDERAKILEISVKELSTPVILSPAVPVIGKSNLTVFSSLVVDPDYSAEISAALFSSAFPGAVYPGAKVKFPRMKTGKNHLVEFNVLLNTNIEYRFRIFSYPLGGNHDISISGPQSTALYSLVPPADELKGDAELGAAILQLNTVSEGAGWLLHSARITTTI